MIYANEQDLRDALIRHTEYIVANEGMHRATTKNIAEKAGINEAYIYRTFQDKDDLIKSAFHENDVRLRDRVLEDLHFLDDTDKPLKERIRNVLTPCLDLMIGISDRCVFYLRYYFSEKYLQLAKSEHDDCFRPVLEALSPYFKGGEDANFIVNFVFEAMLTYVYSASTKAVTEKTEHRENIVDTLAVLLMNYMK